MARKPSATVVAPPPHPAPKRKVDPELLLSDEKKEELRAKARAKIEARDLLDAEEAYLKSQMDALDRERHPEAEVEMREIRVDLALYADRVTLDGRVFMVGELYTVSKAVYDVLKECERMSYRHDREINNNSTDNFYRRERGLTLNWQTGAASRSDNGQPVAVRF